MTSTLQSDLLRGAKKIAEYSGFSVSFVFRHAREGDLPVKKIGGTLIARKSELDAYFSTNKTNPE